MLSAETMMIIVAPLLAVLWILGLLTGVTLGGFLHGLPLCSTVIILVGLLQQSAKRNDPL